ncbi:NERD domain-containing protein [Motilimonas cestriensis]|uniref:NERD domain-containing protein n=1 Tax=Motilimonas cestriensis TaxID=2742685 RepID=A0ABS8W8T1_9GAMM|nr:nuclease-related domain-containing protein [Motilimonas cestriensis]MCE2594913.1 NERD domain-containing protein [Motilimonas cestriensis]
MWLAFTCVAIVFAYLLGKSHASYRISASERKVAGIINQHINPETEVLVNNVTLKLKDGTTTQIDHLLLSQFGVLVIETKDYSGWIFGEQKSAKWTQVLYRAKTRFQNPIRQNYKHIKAIEALFEFLPRQDIHSLVVFSGTASFKTAMPSGVIYVKDLPNCLNARVEKTISLNRVQFCLGRLQFYRLPETKQTDKIHIQNIKTKVGGSTL